MLKRDKRSSAVIGCYTSSIDGHDLHYVVKRSSRCRYARIEFRPDLGLSVVIPRRYALDQVPVLLHEKISWVIRQFTKYRLRANAVRPQGIAVGDSISFLGRQIQVIKTSLLPESNEPAYIMEDQLIVNCTDGETKTMVINWYREQAYHLLKQKADEISNLLDVAYRHLQIRAQKTRWGSCSRHGTLSFNWRLIMFEEAVIDYVVLHEVAHLKQMNHSRRFWTIVERYCPNYAKYRKWLRDHGQQIAGLAGE